MTLDTMQEARLHFLRTHPEMILDITPWQTKAVCTRCQGKIAVDHPCLRGNSVHSFYIDHHAYASTTHKYRCPQCATANVQRVQNKDPNGRTANVFSPIPHTFIRERLIVTGYQRRGWFRRPKPVGLVEIQLLHDTLQPVDGEKHSTPALDVKAGYGTQENVTHEKKAQPAPLSLVEV